MTTQPSVSAIRISQGSPTQWTHSLPTYMVSAHAASSFHRRGDKHHTTLEFSPSCLPIASLSPRDTTPSGLFALLHQDKKPFLSTISFSNSVLPLPFSSLRTSWAGREVEEAAQCPAPGFPGCLSGRSSSLPLEFQTSRPPSSPKTQYFLAACFSALSHPAPPHFCHLQIYQLHFSLPLRDTGMHSQSPFLPLVLCHPQSPCEYLTLRIWNS